MNAFLRGFQDLRGVIQLCTNRLQQELREVVHNLHDIEIVINARRGGGELYNEIKRTRYKTQYQHKAVVPDSGGRILIKS